MLSKNDLPVLSIMLNTHDPVQIKFFEPHKFDLKTLERLFSNPSFFMFGVFDNDKIVGYFFLRCFLNKKSFMGRIVDMPYQGKGIAKNMARILHNFAWESDFRIFSTISKSNFKSLKSQLAVCNYKTIELLEDDYLLLEYLKSEEKQLNH